MWHIPCGPLDRVCHPRDCQPSQQAQRLVPCIGAGSCEVEEVVATHRRHGCPVGGMAVTLEMGCNAGKLGLAPGVSILPSGWQGKVGLCRLISHHL